MIVVNRVVLVTGASSGIGYEIALKFASLGDIVIIHYCNNRDNAMELEKTIRDTCGVDTMVVKADVSVSDEVSNMIDKIVDKYGKIDVVVNNAGIAIDSFFEDKSVDEFKRVLDVNLVGTFLVSKYASKYMDKGSIINVSSTNGIDSNYQFSIDYDASKAGVNIMTKDLAIALGPNIRVNAVAPGWVNTNMNKDLSDECVMEEKKKIIL